MRLNFVPKHRVKAGTLAGLEAELECEESIILYFQNSLYAILVVLTIAAAGAAYLFPGESERNTFFVFLFLFAATVSFIVVFQMKRHWEFMQEIVREIDQAARKKR